MNEELYLRLLEIEGKFFEFLSYAKNFFLVLIGIGLVCYFVEKLEPAEPKTKFFKKDFKKELSVAILNALLFFPLFTFFISITIIAGLYGLVPYQIFDEQLSALPVALQVVMALLITDFSTYWRHRFTHNYMWPYHAFHHSAEEITWLTSLRLHPIDYFAAMLFDTIILYFLGFEGEGIVIANLIAMIYNYFTHMNLNIVYPKPLCYILASPHFHRWHHATDKSAYDKNFCGMFSLYDFLFGTYHQPKELPKAYGLSPRDQKEVPEGIMKHLLHPIKSDLKKFLKIRKH